MNTRSIIKKLIFYGFIITGAAYFMPRERDWSPYFSNQYDTPFGNSILYDNLGDLFPSQKITSNLSSLYEIKDSFLKTPGNFIMIQEQLEMDSLDIDILIKYIEKGNNVFISSLAFPSALLDTLKYKVLSEWGSFSSILPNQASQDTIYHDFYNKNLKRDSSYIISTEYDLTYFLPIDSITKNTGLGWAKNDSMSIFIGEPLGAGRIFLHSNPYCYTNYNMMKDHPRAYISTAFSFLPDKPIIWDEYYNPYAGNKKNQDVLKVIRAKPPLAWAFYIAISGIILFLLFMSKRKQRIIPVLDSFPNESLNLIKTIGNLYFNTSNNKQVATKKINHLYTFLNRHIGLERSMDLDKKKNLIHNKTNLSKEVIDQLLKLTENLSLQGSVSDGQLRALQKYILKIRKEIQK